MKKKILLIYNTSAYLFRLRSELIVSLQDSGFDVYAAVPRDKYVKELGELGVSLIEWRVVGDNKNPLYELQALFSLWLIVRRLAPDVVFNFTIKPVIYGSLIARFRKSIRVFSMIPGRGVLFSTRANGKMKLLRTLVAPVYRFALKANTRVFFQNTEDKQYFLDHGYVNQEQPTLINGSGVDTLKFIPPESRPGNTTFVMVARLLKDKGVIEYLKASSALAEQYPQARWKLVGGASNSGNGVDIAIVESWSQHDQFEYYGEVDDVKPILAESHVFVLPSYYNEGLPRSILEGLAMGLAVITTDWPGCRETVIENRNGFLVPVKSVDDLTRSMAKCISDSKQVSSFATASRELAVQRFDIRLVNQAIIDELLAS